MDFENAVNPYIRFLSNAEMQNQDYTGFTKAARKLYNLLFSGANVPGGRIIISPDGKYFPLEALITNQNDAQPEYFLNNHIVSYTYSIRYLLNDFSGNSMSKNSFLGMAPVQYPEMFHLAPLYRSDASLEKIGLNFKDPEIRIGAQASRSQFMQHFQNYKIIQLYTHASDSSMHDEPVIYFSDSALYLSELIPENKTVARLIVLSACETGNGKLFKGEGVFSFNRGFAALGIPSSVINLWSVDDESTYKLTELFYKYVRDGLALDEALQKAKLDFIGSSSREKKLPYFWAASVLAGTTDPVETANGIHWGLMLDLGLIGLFVLIFYLIKRKPDKIVTA
jgi:CHAT domain-containing protein